MASRDSGHCLGLARLRHGLRLKVRATALAAKRLSEQGRNAGPHFCPPAVAAVSVLHARIGAGNALKPMPAAKPPGRYPGSNPSSQSTASATVPTSRTEGGRGRRNISTAMPSARAAANLPYVAVPPLFLATITSMR